MTDANEELRDLRDLWKRQFSMASSATNGDGRWRILGLVEFRGVKVIETTNGCELSRHSGRGTTLLFVVEEEWENWGTEQHQYRLWYVDYGANYAPCFDLEPVSWDEELEQDIRSQCERVSEKVARTLDW